MSAPAILDGVALIAAERQRQIDVEGWTRKHDAGHSNDDLALAAACYALPHYRRRQASHRDVPALWPWDVKFWKPSYRTTEIAGEVEVLSADQARVRDLVKAGALIAAEIDRLLP